MSLSLYGAVVPSYQQIIPAMVRLLDKAEAWCQERGAADKTLTRVCLAEDMLPFSYQVMSVAHHSANALEGVKSGRFSPDPNQGPADFDGLRAVLDRALAQVNAWTEGDLEPLAGNIVHFEYGEYKMDFVAQDFLLSFSLPNFYFHAATLYDILRWQGLPVGKGHFLGKIRTL